MSRRSLARRRIATETIDPDNLPSILTDLGIAPAPNATVTQRINGGESSIWGIEADYSQQLSFLPGGWSGLGVFANATYLHPKDIRIFSLTAEDGIAKYSANFGVSYKRGRFDGKVSANWVDQRTRGLSGVSVSSTGVITPTTGNNSYLFEYLSPRLQFDVNLSYEIQRELTLFFNVSNLTDAAHRRYLETERSYNRYGEYGARYTIGVKGSF